MTEKRGEKITKRTFQNSASGSLSDIFFKRLTLEWMDGGRYVKRISRHQGTCDNIRHCTAQSSYELWTFALRCAIVVLELLSRSKITCSSERLTRWKEGLPVQQFGMTKAVVLCSVTSDPLSCSEFGSTLQQNLEVNDVRTCESLKYNNITYCCHFFLNQANPSTSWPLFSSVAPGQSKLIYVPGQ